MYVCIILLNDAIPMLLVVRLLFPFFSGARNLINRGIIVLDYVERGASRTHSHHSMHGNSQYGTAVPAVYPLGERSVSSKHVVWYSEFGFSEQLPGCSYSDNYFLPISKRTKRFLVLGVRADTRYCPYAVPIAYVRCQKKNQKIMLL
jgi:hypothetical protein